MVTGKICLLYASYNVMNVVYFIDEDNNDHDDNSINLPREKDLYITFITSLSKQGKKHWMEQHTK